MYILVAGSRQVSDYCFVFSALQPLPQDAVYIHGGAAGADWLAGYALGHLKRRVFAIRADWPRYGRSAGVIRTQLMFSTFSPQLVIAFLPSVGITPGTRYTLELAQKLSIETRIYRQTIRKEVI